MKIDSENVRSFIVQFGGDIARLVQIAESMTSLRTGADRKRWVKRALAELLRDRDLPFVTGKLERFVDHALVEAAIETLVLLDWFSLKRDRVKSDALDTGPTNAHVGPTTAPPADHDPVRSLVAELSYAHRELAELQVQFQGASNDRVTLAERVDGLERSLDLALARPSPTPAEPTAELPPEAK